MRGVREWVMREKVGYDSGVREWVMREVRKWVMRGV